MTEVHIPVLPKLPVIKNAFVIYDPKTERYSSGGMEPWYSKKMKFWKSWGTLKNHLSMFITYDFTDKNNRKYGLQNNPYEDCLIYDTMSNSYVCRVKDLYNEMIIAREEKDKKNG
jgi:hypothetical protein